MENPNPSSEGASKQQELVDSFTFEVALLFFRMTEAARQYLGQGRHSSGRRSVLKSLAAQGPQTVPQMARFRAVSRQHIQQVVNALRSDGLVRMAPNPAHRRSKLVELTDEGRRFLQVLSRREAEITAFLAEGIRLREFRRATDLLREVRRRLESEEWNRLAARSSRRDT